MSNGHDTRVGTLLDETVEFSLSEICSACHVHAELVIELVELGALEPHGRAPEEWRFPGHALRRVERAMNLRRDLELNLAGVALALDLLDEIDSLRSRLQALERSLES